jgi:hypothetical protein
MVAVVVQVVTGQARVFQFHQIQVILSRSEQVALHNQMAQLQSLALLSLPVAVLVAVAILPSQDRQAVQAVGVALLSRQPVQVIHLALPRLKVIQDQQVATQTSQAVAVAVLRQQVACKMVVPAQQVQFQEVL